MADLVVPHLGVSISEAVVGKWLKQIGDAVAVDEPVAELETDKVGDVIGAVEAGKQGKTVAPPPAKAAPPPHDAIPGAKNGPASQAVAAAADRMPMPPRLPANQQAAGE